MVIANIRAMDRYTRSTSWVRLLMVFTLTMVPSFGTTTLIECLPLRPANEGWAANWMFWVRIFVSSCFLSFSASIQLRTLVPAAALTMKSIVLIAIGSASAYVLELILVARFWAFPVPFTLNFGAPAWSLGFGLSTSLIVGAKAFRQNQELRKQLHLMRSLVAVLSPLIIVYPSYNAIYVRLTGHAQMAFVIVLPLIKYTMKWMIKRHIGHTVFGVIIVMTSVDLFESLYLFRCMQAAGTLFSGYALICVDLIQNLVDFRRIHFLVLDIQQEFGHKLVRVDRRDLLQSLVVAASGTTGEYPHVRLRADQLHGAPPNAVAPIAPDTFHGKLSFLEPASGHPMASMLVSPRIQESSEVFTPEATKKVKALLIELNQLLLVEYIEWSVPIFYVFYLGILFQLPNVTHYPETRSMTSSSLLTLERNITNYASMELVSFFYVHWWLRWRYNISAFHVLGITLERCQVIFQALLMAWVIIVLQFTLDHMGMYRSCR